MCASVPNEFPKFPTFSYIMTWHLSKDRFESERDILNSRLILLAPEALVRLIVTTLAVKA